MALQPLSADQGATPGVGAQLAPLPVLLAQLTANPPGGGSGRPGAITTVPAGPLPASCTSTDGKQTCQCGDKGCVAQNTSCFCFVATDPPADGGAGRN